jgi:LemA protein
MKTRRPWPLWYLPALLSLLAVLPLGCSKYNTMVEKEQVVDQRWADVQAQLQRRSDLIPNLVTTVKAEAAYESKTLKDVIEARSRATSIQLTTDDLGDPVKMAAFQKAQDDLSGALSRLLVVQEQYPQLQADEAFHDLRVELEATEDRLLRARELYNAAVADYNAELRKVGGSVVNKITGKPFAPRLYFSASAGAESAPTVNF